MSNDFIFFLLFLASLASLVYLFRFVSFCLILISIFVFFITMLLILVTPLLCKTAAKLMWRLGTITLLPTLLRILCSVNKSFLLLMDRFSCTKCNIFKAQVWVLPIFIWVQYLRFCMQLVYPKEALSC